MSERAVLTICVYCASSGSCDGAYHDAARRLGELLAEGGCTIVYGGSRSGSMGALADGALSRGGQVIGVLPQFLKDLEIAHRNLSELHVVDDMRTRKHQMLSRSDAVVALPGGSGTFEELLEVITLKRLGLYLGPIVIVNTRNFYAPLLALLEAAIAERFMDTRHRAMWAVVGEPDEVLAAVREAAPWSEAARRFAAL